MHPGRGPHIRRTITIWQDLPQSYRLDANPAIVAPIPEDSPEPWLARVWDAAEEILRAAQVWVVVAYSLPSYDRAIRHMFVEAGHGQWIVVCDPRADSLVEKFHALLPDSKVTAGNPLG